MIAKFKILLFTALTVAFAAAISKSFLQSSRVVAIAVFAGNDTSTCPNQDLVLLSLQASISGEVSDGNWFTLGDGKFVPGNLSSVRFSVGQTYIPGPNDKASGQYLLQLVSDDPDGIGPKVQVNDEVKVTLQTAPALVCSNNINVSLDARCEQKIEVTMIQSNPQAPFSNYIITLFDKHNKEIANNTLTKAHIDQLITYKLGHRCTNNFCWGKLMVEDYYPPTFVCKNDTIVCTKDASPKSVGFPIPITAKIDTFLNGKYVVSGWDACSLVTLEFTDEVAKQDCGKGIDARITRRWKAQDAKGNQSTCNQIIVKNILPLNQVVFPKNLDDIDAPALHCLDTFALNTAGFPAISVSGMPNISGCNTLGFQMNDLSFATCGGSYKIVRNWFVIEWCQNTNITHNQIILVKDSRAPKFLVRDSISLAIGAYQCTADSYEIPLPTNVSDCSSFSTDITLRQLNGTNASQWITTINNKRHIDKLPFGQYRLIYTLTDECNNIGRDTTIISTYDNISPFTVCDQNTKVALDAQGKARVFASTFDDGSTDNCGIAMFKVRKMTDNCGFGLLAGDFIDFCCSEIGSVVMVALEVTDIHGNKNTCMVQVTIEDKIAPTITCPPNLTLECTDNYDFNNLDVFGRVVTNAAAVKNVLVNNFYHTGIIGKDGLASDNCSVTVSTSYITDIKCNQGTITRKFVASDIHGGKASCTQVITILNPKPMSATDINWPIHYNGNGCKSSQTEPTITGQPTYINTSCALVAATYEDQFFYIADGACYKVVRTWTVIDWCQFDLDNTKGKWNYIQNIKLKNTDKPWFTSPCRDTMICSYDTDCKTGNLLIVQTALDSCTDQQSLTWTYELDINNDNTVDETKATNTINKTLPLGVHNIKWTVSDQCGNITNCSYKITIRDCKKPTPYCKTSVTSSLMQISGGVPIWARDFNLNSSDNCTAASELIFTFDEAYPVSDMLNSRHFFRGKGILSDSSSYLAGQAQVWIPSTKSSGRFYSCADIPDGKSQSISLNMTVWDANGNSDFCTTTFILQDNIDLCPDVINFVKVSGRIQTVSSITPRATKVNFTSSEASGIKTIDQEGKYQIDSIKIGNTCEIFPSLNSPIMDGVSTVDLVLIQRHLLGIIPFTNPYQYLAADVNLSNGVSAADLAYLRKLILGIMDTLPAHKDCWHFVPKGYTFNDPRSPYRYEKSLILQNVEKDLTGMDFLAIKVGDLDNSYEGDIIDNDIWTTRTQRPTVKLGVKRVSLNGQVLTSIYAMEDLQIDGIQLFAQLGSSASVEGSNLNSIKSNFENQEYYYHNGDFRVVAYDHKPVAIMRNTELFSFVQSENDGQMIALDDYRSSEIIIDDKAYSIQLVDMTYIDDYDQRNASFSIVTNPVVNELKIETKGLKINSTWTYNVVDLKGGLLLNGQIEAMSSTSEVKIPINNLPKNNIYFIQIRYAERLYTLKFLHID